MIKAIWSSMIFFVLLIVIGNFVQDRTISYQLQMHGAVGMIIWVIGIVIFGVIKDKEISNG